MELFFLLLLVGFMVFALSSGYPVAFALPGAAILSISLAALSGYIFAGDVTAYFAHDGPVQWLSTGVTNFRGIYWEVERDTLIAIPLFIFMGIMLEKSKIAEDLLVRMAQLFGPVPGGLGISVIFVGTLLAATTGIVGATVVAMGLISLPAMLRNKYSPSLASGAICASGTLGQIIPPSVVLIILVDQLSNAVDQAATIRKAEYKQATGEFSMPAQFDITSASAGEMFLGAFIPGMVLVGLYMGYILITALIKPSLAPPVKYDGKYDRRFALQVGLSLVPPLLLIFLVLGSIIAGVATVNQAGAIGAIGALIMAGYRLREHKKHAYLPAIIAAISTVAIFIFIALFDLNVKNISSGFDILGIALASIAVAFLLGAIAWSAWRCHRIGNVLNQVMIDTAKTTSLVFIILLGAAMLTAAFRGFGGEELVRGFLTSLPGGFWTQFIVVMIVIFLLGFFLDFIEIAVVVVPIVAPILLANTEANITAIWLGVMVGLNIQTSFLTPPFGFALFYLRGVAGKAVKTVAIYKGVVVFIGLQLLALGIVGFYPPLVNYLPSRAYLASENAPPPRNPQLQQCLEQNLFAFYKTEGDALAGTASILVSSPMAFLPTQNRQALVGALQNVPTIFELAVKAEEAEQARLDFLPEYEPLHRTTRTIQRQAANIDQAIAKAERRKRNSAYDDTSDAKAAQLTARIEELKLRKAEKLAEIPEQWAEIRKTYAALAADETKARVLYRRTADKTYETIAELYAIISGTDELSAIAAEFETITPSADSLKTIERQMNKLAGTSDIRKDIVDARRALEKDRLDEANEKIATAMEKISQAVAWQSVAKVQLGDALGSYLADIQDNIGLRLQARLPSHIAKDIAACRSHHRDISLAF